MRRLSSEGKLRSTLRISVCLAAASGLFAADTPTFDTTVAPIVTRTCTPCHNANLASGGVNLAPFAKAASLKENREGWEVILRKVRAGEMPPKGVPRPTQMDAAIQFLSDEFERADRNLKPDPGRVTARRLNRAEYTNTIRDLLGVEFRAQAEFPTDDLGNGFDNIGDVLTISPVLMEKYLAAAQRIASRARGRCQAGDAGVLDGRQAADHDAGGDEAFGPCLLQSVFRSRDAPLAARRRARFPRRLPERRFRQDPDPQGRVQQQDQ